MAFKRGIIKDKTRQGTSALRAVCKYTIGFLLERSIVILQITMKFVVFDTIHHVIFCISTINQLTNTNLKTLYGLNTVLKGTRYSAIGIVL